jgi:uncharacterized membrane protein
MACFTGFVKRVMLQLSRMKRLFLTLGLLLFLPGLVFAQGDEPSLEDQLVTLEGLEEQLDDINAVFDSFSIETLELKAEVVEIISDEEVNGQRQMVFVADADGELYTIDTQQGFLEGLRYNIKVGDKIYIQVIKDDGEVFSVFLVDVIRTGNLFLIILLFAAVIIAVGRWRGLASLAGLAITLLILFLFIVPQILNGNDPVLITIIGSLLILAVNMHLSHGFNKGTLLAFASTVAGLSLVWIFSNLFVSFSRLSGMASEEAILLQFNSETVAGPGGILLAAIILGAVGVLDDIAITQSETIAELRVANPKMTSTELFKAGMRVGRHHIASTVNTLVLAYAGVALPLILLFMHTQGVDLMRFLNEEAVAEEIVRTLAGTLALILTVPIATWLATYVNKR